MYKKWEFNLGQLKMAKFSEGDIYVLSENHASGAGHPKSLVAFRYIGYSAFDSSLSH